MWAADGGDHTGGIQQNFPDFPYNNFQPDEANLFAQPTTPSVVVPNAGLQPFYNTNFENDGSMRDYLTTPKPPQHFENNNQGFYASGFNYTPPVADFGFPNFDQPGGVTQNPSQNPDNTWAFGEIDGDAAVTLDSIEPTIQHLGNVSSRSPEKRKKPVRKRPPRKNSTRKEQAKTPEVIYEGGHAIPKERDPCLRPTCSYCRDRDLVPANSNADASEGCDKPCSSKACEPDLPPWHHLIEKFKPSDRYLRWVQAYDRPIFNFLPSTYEFCEFAATNAAAKKCVYNPEAKCMKDVPSATPKPKTPQFPAADQFVQVPLPSDKTKMVPIPRQNFVFNLLQLDTMSESDILAGKFAKEVPRNSNAPVRRAAKRKHRAPASPQPGCSKS